MHASDICLWDACVRCTLIPSPVTLAILEPWRSGRPEPGKQKPSYLFSYILSHGFPTSKASYKETESIFAIAVTCFPKSSKTSNSGDAPTPKTTSAGNPGWTDSCRSRHVLQTRSIPLYTLPLGYIEYKAGLGVCEALDELFTFLLLFSEAYVDQILAATNSYAKRDQDELHYDSPRR